MSYKYSFAEVGNVRDGSFISSSIFVSCAPFWRVPPPILPVQFATHFWAKTGNNWVRATYKILLFVRWLWFCSVHFIKGMPEVNFELCVSAGCQRGAGRKQRSRNENVSVGFYCWHCRYWYEYFMNFRQVWRYMGPYVFISSRNVAFGATFVRAYIYI